MREILMAPFGVLVEPAAPRRTWVFPAIPTYRLVSVSDTVSVSESVEWLRNPLLIDVSDENPVAEGEIAVNGANLTVALSDAISGIDARLLGGAASGTNLVSVDIPVVADGNMVLFAVSASDNGFSVRVPTISGMGLTWEFMESLVAADGAGDRMTLWRAVTGPRPISGVVHIEFGETILRSAVFVLGLSAADLTDPIVQSSKNWGFFGAGAFTLDLSTLVSERSSILSFCLCNHPAGAGVGPTAPYIEIADFIGNDTQAVRANAAWLKYPTSTTACTWTKGAGGSGHFMAQILVEVRGLAPGDVASGRVPDTYQAYDDAPPVEAVEIHVGTNPSVSDSDNPFDPLTVFESVRIGLSPLVPVFDSVVVADQVFTALSASDIVVASAAPSTEYVEVDLSAPFAQFDTIGEELLPQEFLQVSFGPEITAPRIPEYIADAVQPAEFVRVEISAGRAINVFDDDVPADVVLVVVNPLAVSVVDTDTPTEDVVLDIQNLELSVADAVAAAEAVAVVVNPLTANVVDTTPAAELAQAAIPMGVVVFDDSTFPPLEPPPMPVTGIARDYVDVEEGFEMGLGIPVLVFDDTPAADVVAIGLRIPVQAHDVLSVVDVIDTDAVTINPVLVGFDQVVADTISPVDVVILVRVLAIDVSDNVGPADPVTARLPMQVVAADELAPFDVPSVESLIRPGVFDAVPVSDEVAALVSVLLAAVADENPGEDVVLTGIPMAISVADVPEEGAVTDRRNIALTKYYEDVHFINDALIESSRVVNQAMGRKS
jgi:hypothetical protein